MGQYSLAEHVFVCVNDEHVVLLDLKADRYWALEAAKTAPLGDLVPGWPVHPQAGAANDPGDAQEVAEALCDQGILSGPHARGKDATPVTPAAAARELLSQDEYKRVPIGLAAVLRFIASSVTAKASLRLRPFERVILEFTARKRAGLATAQPLDPEVARRLVQTFARLRVFFFTSKNECLFDSLALLGFLARYGIYADWVFGVQARPFAAHCWVQKGEVVFNDTVEHVSGYTPIMTA
jgi:hypothetical protein